MAKKVQKLRRDIRWLEEEFAVAKANYDLICQKWNQPLSVTPEQVLSNLREKLQAYEDLDGEEQPTTGVLQATQGTDKSIPRVGGTNTIGIDIDAGEPAHASDDSY